MFGIDVVDLIPGGTIEDMVHQNGADLLLMGMQAARAHYKLQEGERMSFQFIEHVEDGRPTIVLLPLVLDAATLQTKRKLPYYDVPKFLRTAPIAQWVSMGKQAKKTAERVDELLAKLKVATAKGQVEKVAAITKQVDEALASLPEGVKGMLRLTVANGMVQDAAKPEAPAAEEPMRLDTRPAHEAAPHRAEEAEAAHQHVEAPGIAATDEEPATESNDTTHGAAQ